MSIYVLEKRIKAEQTLCYINAIIIKSNNPQPMKKVLAQNLASFFIAKNYFPFHVENLEVHYGKKKELLQKQIAEAAFVSSTYYSFVEKEGLLEYMKNIQL